MKITAKELRLWDIADHLSRNLLRSNQPLSHEEVFRELVVTELLKKGSFEDEDGNSCLRIATNRWISSDGAEPDQLVPRSIGYNRRRLIFMITQLVELAGVDKFRLVPKLSSDGTEPEPWSKLKQDIQWENFERLDLKQIDAVSLRILKGLRLSELDYHAFEQRREQRGEKPLPDFWARTSTGEDTKSLTHTGMPGRPTAKNLIVGELTRRWSAGELCNTVTQESDALHEWVKREFPQIAAPTRKTIRNTISSDFRRFKSKDA